MHYFESTRSVISAEEEFLLEGQVILAVKNGMLVVVGRHMDRINDHHVPQAIYILKTEAEDELQRFQVDFSPPSGDCYRYFL